MSYACAAALTLACGCSLVYDASELQGGERDAGGGDRDVGPRVDVGPGIDTGPAADTGPVPDTGSMPDGGTPMSSSCRGMGPVPVQCSMGSLTPLSLTSVSFSPAGIAVLDVAGQAQVRVATVDEGVATIHTMVVATSSIDFVEEIVADAPLIPHREMAIRRIASDQIAMVVLGTPDKTSTGLSVITTESRAPTLRGLTTASWTVIGTGTGAPRSVLGPPAVTGGSRHGCDVPAHFFWRLFAGSEVWLGSLEAERRAPEYFEQWLATPHPTTSIPVATTAGTIVVLSDARSPIGSVLWDLRGGAATTFPLEHEIGATREVGAAALANGSFAVAWRDPGGNLFLHGMTCSNTCARDPMADDLACAGADCEPDGNMHTRGDSRGLFALEAMPGAGFVLAHVANSGMNVNLTFYGDDFAQDSDALVLTLPGGLPISGIALDTVVSGTDIVVVGALTVDGAMNDFIHVFGLRIGIGC